MFDRDLEFLRAYLGKWHWEHSLCIYPGFDFFFLFDGYLAWPLEFTCFDFVSFLVFDIRSNFCFWD